MKINARLPSGGVGLERSNKNEWNAEQKKKSEAFVVMLFWAAA